MGIRVFENELYNTSDDDDECLSCTTSTTIEPEMQQTLNVHFSKHQNATTATNLLTSKDLVGNSKAFRIENNKCNLRIIGNNNRIRITNNFGNLQIIGNNTRLKITKNNGHIKYTGNEGRICLGSESTQQTVDYIGCNGLLKVVNSMEFNKTPRNKSNNSCGKNNITSTTNNNNSKNKIATKSAHDKPTNFTGNAIHGRSPQHSSSSASSSPSATTNSPLKPKLKSASSDSINDFKNAQWQEFNNLMQQEGWQHFAKVSLPNLNDNLKCADAAGSSGGCKCKCKQKPTKTETETQKTNNLNNKSKRNTNSSRNNSNRTSKNIHVNSHTNIVNNFGDIIIKNSVNVSIA